MLNEHLKYLNKSNDYPVDFPVCTDKKNQTTTDEIWFLDGSSLHF